MEKIIVKDGYSFTYENIGGVGSIANIDHKKDFEIEVDKIGDRYHCDFHLNGIYVQVWCLSYSVDRIGDK